MINKLNRQEFSKQLMTFLNRSLIEEGSLIEEPTTTTNHELTLEKFNGLVDLSSE